MPVGKKRNNAKISPNVFPYNLDPFNRFIFYVGKTIFLLLYFAVYTVLSAPYITGHFVGTYIWPIFEDLFNAIPSFMASFRNYFLRYKKRSAKYLIKYKKFFTRKVSFSIVFFVHTAKKKKLKKPKRYFGTKLEILHILPKTSTPKIVKKRFYSARFLQILTLVLIFVFGLSASGGALFYWYILKDLPSPGSLTDRSVAVSTKIYDRNGILLYTIYKDQNRTPISLSEIPLQMKVATLAAEDAQFYTHPGFSVRGIIRSIKDNIQEGTLTGGSTITQQLVKNALLTSEKTLLRKLKEVTLAILVERMYTKDQILEMYLNEVSFGGTSYGVEEAAKTYFGKNIKDITVSEAALLAGLPKSPTRYSPFGNTTELAIGRQKEVLRLMEQNGFITGQQREEAEATPLIFSSQKTDIKAPHFVAYVRDILEKRYGKDTVERGGLNVTTSLDINVQEYAEKVIAGEVEKLAKLRVGNGAAVILNPQTGEILAMVGSKDYFDTKNNGNVNVVLRPRQPGSSIKVVNYAYALSNGYNPASILEDTPVTFLVDGQQPYTPKNYEGGFRGKITLRSALAESRNIPAVRILQANGIKNMIDLGTRMGITTWTNPDNYGLSLTLGGGEVKLIDLAQVYATVANYGNRPPIAPILKVTNYKGEVLDEQICIDALESQNQVAKNQTTPTPESLFQNSGFSSPVNAASESASRSSLQKTNTCVTTPVLDPRVAFMLTDILKDNNARSPAFGRNSLLVIPKHPEVAVKTGTSNDLRDNLAVGYTKDFVVAVWVGNNDNSQMNRIASGITGATPIWNKILSSLIADKPTYDWTIPQGLTKVAICPYKGSILCLECFQKEEWFFTEDAPTQSCKAVFERENKEQERKALDQQVKKLPQREIIDLRQIGKEIEERLKRRGKKSNG